MVILIFSRLGQIIPSTSQYAKLLLPIHDFRENGSTCITLRQCVSASVRQSVTLLLTR